MKKNLLIAAIAITALASCSSNDFVGDESPQTSSGNVGAISFTSGTPAITRATGAEAASALGNSFNVYGTKTVSGTSGDETSNVFATNTYAQATTGDASAGTYTVSWTANSGGSTASNTSGWDYVTGNQTIKYWDYSAKKYEFVAYKATVGSPTIAKYRINGFTVTASAEQLAGLYVADKITLNNTGENPDVNNQPTKPATGYNKIGNIVQFTFRSSATKVRLGIYETIPGYQVRKVEFRPNTSGQGAEFVSSKTNAILSGSFNGTSSSTEGTYNVTYDGETGVAVFGNTAAASNHFDFGTFASQQSVLGESSTTPMWASGSANYQIVLPNTDHVGNMILYVDYELYNSVSGETIGVYGAKAVVPSIYMKWNPNYAYTYLFKISDNTNGTTGTEGTSPEGLFPITFDAVSIATTDGPQVGTITTVSTPAITTYQNGSVSESGITYANANGAIYITVNTNGTLETLTSKIKLYKLDAADADATEADLVLVPSKLTNKEVTGEVTDKLTILSGDGETVQGITFAASTSAKFTPSAGETYAVEFTDSGVKHYKVIKVAAAQ